MRRPYFYLFIFLVAIFVSHQIVRQIRQPSPARDSIKDIAVEDLSPTGHILTGKKIPINTDSAAMLEALPGIGPALAQRIIETRQERGNFKNEADLEHVRGLGPAKISQFRALISY